jgi:hypothetical protein
MTMKISTVLLGAALLTGALAAVYFSKHFKFSTCQTEAQYKPAKTRKAVQCRYIYDEMARKLVAYSVTETCLNESSDGFTYKLGSRIMKFARRGHAEQQLILL